MNDELAKLKQLQDLYLERWKILSAQGTLGDDIAHRAQLLKKTEAYEKMLSEQIDAARLKSKSMELDLQKNEEKRKTSEERVTTAKNIAQLEALQKEIDTAKSEGSKLESDLIKLYSGIENLEKKKKEIDEKRVFLEHHQKNAEKELESITAQQKLKLKQLEQLIEAKRKNIDEKMLEYFDKKSQNGKVAVVVPADGQKCTNCNRIIPLQDYINLKAGKGIVECPFCDSLLYIDYVKKDN